MDDNERRAQAIERLTQKAHYRSYLVTWAGVSLLLVAIWGATALTSGHLYYFWPAWAIGGMGIGAAVKGWAIYGNRAITEDAIRAEMQR
jgi:hypothetical protein